VWELGPWRSNWGVAGFNYVGLLLKHLPLGCRCRCVWVVAFLSKGELLCRRLMADCNHSSHAFPTKRVSRSYQQSCSSVFQVSELLLRDHLLYISRWRVLRPCLLQLPHLQTKTVAFNIETKITKRAKTLLAITVIIHLLIFY